MCEVQFLGSMAAVFGMREAKIPLEKPTRLGDLFEAKASADVMIVLINQAVGSFDSLVGDGDRVVIMPIISGG